MTSCWIVTEGIAGTENQCLGVAEALGVMPQVKRISLRLPWRILSPWLGFESAATFGGDELAPPWPDLVIAGGRKAVAAARYIGRQSDGRTFTVMMQNPRTDTDSFDLVAAPAHDGVSGANVIVTTAAPNRITPARLAVARDEFSSQLSALPVPRVAVLIGGSSKAYRMTAGIAAALAAQLAALADKGYGLMVTASRRTGQEGRALLEEKLRGRQNVFFWDGGGVNPYFGLLAWADYILVTADSVSMLSEAATTGKPVYMIPLPGGSPRFERFHQNLAGRGIIRIFDGSLQPYDYTPLADAALVAAEIRKRLEKRNIGLYR